MTVAQFIADAIAVTQYLGQRFGKDRIILVGHSWGSFLGIQVAAAAPDLFHAYVGMGQVSYQLRSEVAAHRAMLVQYRARGDTAMVARLKAAPVSMADGPSPAYLRLRDKAMHGLGCGTTRDMASVITGVFLPVWKCPAYTIREKIDIWRGLSFSRGFLWDAFLRTDLTQQIKMLDLPVYFLGGAHDLTANHGLSRDFFAQITAPVKGFYTFQDSAHGPLFEVPRLGREILTQEVLSQETRLSDKAKPH
jgi:pimeloyl-ACP methyl ester carboxylesterase